MFGKVSAVIGLRLRVQALKKSHRSAEKGVVAIARHHVRRAGDVGELCIWKLRDEGFRRLVRHQLAQPASDEMHREPQFGQSRFEHVDIS